jgi:hypothetical protein
VFILAKLCPPTWSLKVDKVMKIERLDHLVLTRRISPRHEFYVAVLGMEVVTLVITEGLRFGSQKLNLHETGKEFELVFIGQRLARQICVSLQVSR